MNAADAPLILSIESSCDDSGAAVLRGLTVLSNVVYSQTVHEQYGGVVPELASRAHSQTVVPTIEAALAQAGVAFEDLDAVAATEGPGLLGSLLVGHGTAKSIAQSLEIPFIGVHHIQAHVLAHALTEPGIQDAPLQGFPFLALVVSGGHTQLFDVHGPFDFRLLGGTMDDAVGEAFDKAAKMFGLPYPGGPEVDRRAELGNPDRFSFAKMQTPGLDFSYSGLKTSILYRIQKEVQANPHTLTEDLNDWCASARQALVQPLLERLDRAHRPEHRYAVLAGGVAANRLLRREAQEWASRKGITMGIPPLSYATDNAAMIGAVAYYGFSEQRFSDLGRAASARLEVPSQHD
jgi:N6-L-threonylcarbamoyladenine synthase